MNKLLALVLLFTFSISVYAQVPEFSSNEVIDPDNPSAGQIIDLTNTLFYETG